MSIHFPLGKDSFAKLRQEDCYYVDKTGRAILLEIKRARTLWEMDAKCDEALEQIEDRQYARALENEFGEILCCGICFFKKKCRVKMKPHFIDKSPYYC